MSTSRGWCDQCQDVVEVHVACMGTVYCSACGASPHICLSATGRHPVFVMDEETKTCTIILPAKWKVHVAPDDSEAKTTVSFADAKIVLEVERKP